MIIEGRPPLLLLILCNIQYSTGLLTFTRWMKLAFGSNSNSHHLLLLKLALLLLLLLLLDLALLQHGALNCKRNDVMVNIIITTKRGKTGH